LTEGRPGYSQPDGNGGTVTPYEFTSLTTPDIGHSWSAVHGEWDSGAMDGFNDDGPDQCNGVLHRPRAAFLLRLLNEVTLCGNYFCSLLGPTWPNRFYLSQERRVESGPTVPVMRKQDKIKLGECYIRTRANGSIPLDLT
jgi:phospholipase C